MPDLTDHEIEAEGYMSRLGADTYRSRVERARQKERESTTPAGRHLLRAAVGKVARGVQEWLDGETAKGGRAKGQAFPGLLECGADTAALIACTVVLDAISRPRSFTSIATTIGRRIEDELLFRQMAREARPLLKKLLRQTSRSGYEHRRRVLKLVANREDAIESEPWPRRIALRVGMVCLDIFLAEAGLVEEVEHRQGVRVVKNIRPRPETMAWLEKSHEDHEFLFPFWMPTLEPPLPWDGLYGGGYHTDILVRRPLVKFMRRAHAKVVPHHAYNRTADAVNILQNTAWRINQDVYEVARHFWDASVEVPGLPAREDMPIPTRPEDIETNESARKDWRRKAAVIHERNNAERSRRLDTVRTLFIAEHYRGKSHVYFPHHCDWRGRIYTTPNFLHPQGTEFSRALLTFSEAKPLDPTGAKWLAIHGANVWGADKLPYNERLAWIESNREKIHAVYEDPIDCLWWTEADKPWLFLAFCLEWGRFLEEGYGMMSRLPIAMDGTNNGLQLYSLLMRDGEGAQATNVAPTAKPRDIYQDVADTATEHLQFIAQHGGTKEGDDDIARAILDLCDGRLPRTATKRPVMTLPYGARPHSCRKYLRAWLDSQGASDESFDMVRVLSPVVWSAIGRTLHGARAAMEWLRAVAQIATDHDVPLQWTTPVGFVVRQEYLNYATREIRTVIGDRVRHSNVREDTDRLRASDQLDGVAPNYIHSLDAACMVGILTRAAERGIGSFCMIHDSYGTHAADADSLAKVIRLVYADTFTPDLLARFRSEVLESLPDGVELPEPPTRGEFDVQSIRASAYAFA
jgi:DNA-directed RNA polymerase